MKLASLGIIAKVCKRQFSSITPYYPGWQSNDSYKKGKFTGRQSFFQLNLVFWAWFFVLWVVMGGDRVRMELDNCKEFRRDPSLGTSVKKVV